MHKAEMIRLFGSLALIVPLLGVIVWTVVNMASRLRASFRTRGPAKTAALCFALLIAVLYGADKSPVVKPLAALQMCLSYFGRIYPATAPIADRTGADLADTRARNADQAVSVAIDAGHLASELSDATLALAPDATRCLIDLDWFHDTRAPASPNPLASQIYVESFTSNSMLMDMHYIAFSEEPSSAPQMYFQYYDADSEQLAKAECIGWPATVQVVSFASGLARTNTCYRMLNVVPVDYITRSRTWDGEVLFGGPVGSAVQFEASGVFIISDINNTVWQGRSWTGAINGDAVEFINGILVAPPGMLSAEAPTEGEAQ